MPVSVSVSVLGWAAYSTKKEESLKPVGVLGFFLELLADLFAFLPMAKIKDRLRQAVAGDARPHRI